MRRPAGSMVTVLVVSTLAVMMAFLLAGAVFGHLGIAARFEDRQRARNAAESALAHGVERILEAEEYGRNRQASDRVEVREGDAVGLLTFHQAEAGRRRAGYSTNNLRRDTSVSGWGGRIVSADAAHLVATGTCGASTRTMEALVHFPPFPFALSSSGSVKSEGGLLVAAVEDPADVAGGAQQIPPEKLRRGHLASNSRNERGVELSSESRVTGDLRSAGGVHLHEGASVGGELLQNVTPRNLPKVTVDKYDPGTGAGVQQLGASLETPTLEGMCRSKPPGGTLRVSGDLNLDGAVLFVEGDLVVEGTIKGQGAVVVKGRTSVSGTARIETDNQAALLSQGDVTIAGSAREGSFFQGLVYTEGDFRASDVTLVGAMVANKPGASGSAMTLRDVNVVEYAKSTDLDVQLKVDPKYLETDAVSVGPAPRLNLSGLNMDNAGDARLRSDDFARNCTWHAHVMASLDSAPLVSDGGDPPTYDASAVTPANSIKIAVEVTDWPGGIGRGPAYYRPIKVAPLNEAMSYMRGHFGYGSVVGPAQEHANAIAARLKQRVATYNQQVVTYRTRRAQALEAARTAAAARARFDFDLNRFLQREDTIRVLVWREAASETR